MDEAGGSDPCRDWLGDYTLCCLLDPEVDYTLGKTERRLAIVPVLLPGGVNVPLHSSAFRISQRTVVEPLDGPSTIEVVTGCDLFGNVTGFLRVLDHIDVFDGCC